MRDIFEELQFLLCSYGYSVLDLVFFVVVIVSVLLNLEQFRFCVIERVNFEIIVSVMFLYEFSSRFISVVSQFREII